MLVKTREAVQATWSLAGPCKGRPAVERSMSRSVQSTYLIRGTYIQLGTQSTTEEQYTKKKCRCLFFNAINQVPNEFKSIVLYS